MRRVSSQRAILPSVSSLQTIHQMLFLNTRSSRLRLSNMGLDPKLYTLHGFRHAGIQECLLAEGNLALCKLSSDHSSDAILEYAFIPPERRLRISSKVYHSLASAIASCTAGVRNLAIRD